MNYEFYVHGTIRSLIKINCCELCNYNLRTNAKQKKAQWVVFHYICSGCLSTEMVLYKTFYLMFELHSLLNQMRSIICSLWSNIQFNRTYHGIIDAVLPLFP